MADISCPEAAVAAETGGQDHVRTTMADRLFYPGVNTCLTITFLLYAHTWKSRTFACAGNAVGNMVAGHVNSFFMNDINGPAAANDLLTNRLLPLVAQEARIIQSVVFAGAVGLDGLAGYALPALRRLIEGRYWFKPAFKLVDTSDLETVYIVFDGPGQQLSIRSGRRLTIGAVVAAPTLQYGFDGIPDM